MQQGVRSALQAVSPLLKSLKERQQLYFELLSFVTKNIDSSSNDLDSTTIFNRFLPSLRTAHTGLSQRQHAILGQLSQAVFPAEGASKELMRLSSRIIQLLEASVGHVRKGIFDQSGRATKEFARFKLALHKIIKRPVFAPSEYGECIINYTTAKFTRQITKLEKYLERVSQGEEVCLRQFYGHGSDFQTSSPDERVEKKSREPVTLKKHQMRLNIDSHANGEQEKKPRRTLKSTVKKREKLQTTRHKAKEEEPREQSSDDERPTKEQTANKLLKFYALLQLNRKQFLEDYVYEKAVQERHKTELLNRLIQRNKAINSQINNYVRKSTCYLPVPLIIMPPPARSSGDEREYPKVNSRTSFVITKRRGSFHLQSSDQHESVVPMERSSIKDPPVSNPRRRSSHSNQRGQERSRKLFVVKQPMVFEDEVIPQAQVTHTQWLQAPMSIKRGKNNDNIRLKRKPGPNPLENANLAQNFRYPF